MAAVVHRAGDYGVERIAQLGILRQQRLHHSHVVLVRQPRVGRIRGFVTDAQVEIVLIVTAVISVILNILPPADRLNGDAALGTSLGRAACISSATLSSCGVLMKFTGASKSHAVR